MEPNKNLERVVNESLDYIPLKITLPKIKKALIEEDVEGLLKLGAPSDEYDGMAREIYDKLRPDSDYYDVARAVYLVFLENFFFEVPLGKKELKGNKYYFPDKFPDKRYEESLLDVLIKICE